MIRTVIEVCGKDEHEFSDRLTAALAQLGYQPIDIDRDNFIRDLRWALHDAGHDARALVLAYRKKMGEGVADE